MNKLHIYYKGELEDTHWCSNHSEWKEEALKKAIEFGCVGKDYSFKFEEN